jgi:hypothetical protein
MQKELIKIRKRRSQAQMDQVLRQRRKRKSLNHKQPSLAPSNNFFSFINLRTLNTKVYQIRICVAPRKNGFINTHDISKTGKKDEHKKENSKTKKSRFSQIIIFQESSSPEKSQRKSAAKTHGSKILEVTCPNQEHHNKRANNPILKTSAKQDLGQPALLNCNPKQTQTPNHTIQQRPQEVVVLSNFSLLQTKKPKMMIGSGD